MTGTTHTTICRFCHAYCGIEVDVEDNRVVDAWAAQLRSTAYVRRIDVVRTFCKEAGRTCVLSYSDPWASDVPL